MAGPLPPIPMVILTGFLGAGKTTRLNRWLADPALADTLVIINEFGSVGLDHLLVEETPGEMVLMAAGCLCCTIRGDLVATLEDLLRRRDNRRITPFQRILIETTGLADPLPILQSVLQHPYLSKRFGIAGLVTLVDAVHAGDTLARHAEARRQVALADRLLLTKQDLAGPGVVDALEDAVSGLNPTTRLLREEPPDFASTLFDNRFEPWCQSETGLEAWLGAAEAASPLHAPEHDPNRHGADIQSFSFISEQPVRPEALIVFQEAMRILHGPRLLRLKGLVAMADDQERPAVIHHVQSVTHPMQRLSRWPGRDRRTRLVFIVQGIPRETIETFWSALVRTEAGAQDTR
ncbi:MAG: GTP-binding protein [Beijerinckiaceae bacterium]|nr:GTP-binding protein [Beijerinckiaceae bacterium]